MLGDLFLGSIIRSALGVRRGPSLGALRYFGGGMPGMGLGMNLGTLLGTAGLAWGAYEHFKDRTPSTLTTIEGGGFPSSGAPPPIPYSGAPSYPGAPSYSGTPSYSGAPGNPPPIPYDATTSSPDGPDAMRRLVALTIAAARADGELGEEEYGKILEAARQHGAEKLVQEELRNPRTIQEIVVGAGDARLRSDLYALAYGIVRADGSVSPAERKFMKELATTLGFDSEAAAKIEQETSEKIDQHAG
jgi:uncharacterized membrane protein YebE (DUF533 family)